MCVCVWQLLPKTWVPILAVGARLFMIAGNVFISATRQKCIKCVQIVPPIFAGTHNRFFPPFCSISGARGWHRPRHVHLHTYFFFCVQKPSDAARCHGDAAHLGFYAERQKVSLMMEVAFPFLIWNITGSPLARTQAGVSGLLLTATLETALTECPSRGETGAGAPFRENAPNAVLSGKRKWLPFNYSIIWTYI